MLATTTLLLAMVLSGPAGPPVQSSEEFAIRDVVRQYVEARERRDPAAIGVLFTDDADQLTSSGEWRRGREGVVRGALASSARTGGTRAIVVQQIRFPTDGVALADGRYEISGLAGGRTRTMWTTFVMTRDRQGAGWRIAAIRNMLPAEQPRPDRRP